ncbi:DUF190 domain-containing protein [Telmatobacter bradus]|uniref:DUF190 domain-containing protein n=1 Tax=Telmatobacter bradus TaxID=474953 RepID=UPI003B436FD9
MRRWNVRGMLAGQRREVQMLATGKAVKVTLYLSDGVTHHGVPIYSSILDYLFHSGIAGATVLKGVAGFGMKHRLHSAHLLDISDHLPILVKFIDTAEKVEAILPELEKRAASGLIEVEETRILVPSRE